MKFLISASTDIGLTKQTNQDSLSVKKFNTPYGEMVFAILCDGMGGLEKGELASATVIHHYTNWIDNEFAKIMNSSNVQAELEFHFSNLAVELNEKIKSYGQLAGFSLGTTISALLIFNGRYYIINIGDTRVYNLSLYSQVLTKDHSVVARAVENGEITPEQARTDKRRNILLQCIGASNQVYPDFFCGDVKRNEVFMLCSDGFIHEISSEEMYSCLNPYTLTDEMSMKYYSDYLIDIVKQRRERDNISVIVIKVI